MKNVKSLIVGLLALAAVELNAQTTNPLLAIGDGIKQFFDSTNTVYVGGAERSLTGDAWKVYGLVLYNVDTTIGTISPGIGIAHEWTPSHEAAPNSFNVTAGLQWSATLAPAERFGVTNVMVIHPYAGTFLGTPFTGQNQGGLMNETTTGLAIIPFKFKIGNALVSPVLDVHYSNETGTGYYQRNYAGGSLGINIGNYTQPTLSDNRNANAWSTQCFALSE